MQFRLLARRGSTGGEVFFTSNYSYVVININAIDSDGKQIIFRLWYGCDEDKNI